MVRKRKTQQLYPYKCTLTGRTYVCTSAAPHPDELVSVAGYYELHPDEDDRPERIKKLFEETQPAPSTPENNA